MRRYALSRQLILWEILSCKAYDSCINYSIFCLLFVPYDSPNCCLFIHYSIHLAIYFCWALLEGPFKSFTVICYRSFHIKQIYFYHFPRFTSRKPTSFLSLFWYRKNTYWPCWAIFLEIHSLPSLSAFKYISWTNSKSRW